MDYRRLVSRNVTKEVWVQSFANELGRLAQGVGQRHVGTDTIFFTAYEDIPTDRRKYITYGKIIVDYKPHKNDPHRTRHTFGGDHIIYPDPVATPTAEIVTTKLLINSTISTPNARFITADIVNF